MRNLIIASLLLLIVGSVSAQSDETLDIPSTTSKIVDKLTSSLSLTAEQKPQVEAAVTDFLTKKVAILSLQKTDPSGYSSRFNLLNGGFIGKLKTILLAKQMTSYLGLKPKTNDPASNVLSHLFY